MLTSTAFGPNDAIPGRYTCDGAGISPALSWSGAPQDGALALIVDDPDAPRGVFTHWVLYDVPIDMHELPEGVPATECVAGGAAQGRNGWDTLGYGGPCPPPGDRPHRYRFTLYALDTALGLDPGASKERVLDVMRGQIKDQAELVGTYQRAAQS